MAAGLIILIAAFVVLLTIWILQIEKKRKSVENIPGPPALPLIGNAHQLAGTSKEFYNTLIEYSERWHEHGVFRLWVGTQLLVGFYKAETVEVVLQSSKILDKATEYRFLHPWLGTGLLTSTGSKWHSRRKLLTPSFHFKILNDFVGVFQDQAQTMVKRLDSMADRGTFNIFSYITLCALDIICETAMGKTVDAQGNTDSEYVKCVYKIAELILKRQRTPWYGPDFLYNTIGDGKEHAHCLKVLHEFTEKVILEKTEEFSKKQESGMTMENVLSSHDSNEDAYMSRKNRLAFLDMLLYAKQDGKPMSSADIREEVDTFMFEGHDTTASGMNWLIHLLGANPDIQKKVHEEMDSIFGNSDRPLTMKDLQEMKYLECCIKEALRIFPPVPFFGRSLTEDCKIGKYTVPKGSTVVISPASLHKDPRYFPDPEKFDPDRFLPENSRKRHPYAYVPFSAGPRNCIGQKFALLEEKAVISTILRKFTVISKQKREELCPIGELILRPENGILVELHSRIK
uniref:Putative cytochrome P450 4V2 n=1 Tax=Pinctada fucata TaxID=50426 RepID=A0A194ALH3_PINFU